MSDTALGFELHEGRGGGRLNPSSLEFTLPRLAMMVLATLLLVAAAPLMVAVALAIRLHDGGPVLFRQTRVGRGGHLFSCLKFRSMVPNAEEKLAELLKSDPAARQEWETEHKLKADPRVTPVGEFLRKSSLDELPQLLNVVRGEMSLVGPRPIVPREAARYGARLRSYCSVRPGITGLWQVSGRNDVSYRRRVAMDVLYARKSSLALDAAILARTVPAVLLRRGSY